MTTVYDVPADAFIKHVASELEKSGGPAQPDWSAYVKTGGHVEKAPEDPAWWFVRSASVLRKVYMSGPVGVSRLAAEYGGARNRGSKPEAAVKGSGALARRILKGLEEAGLVDVLKGRGRVVSNKGRSFCDNQAHAVMKDVAVKIPALAKY